MTANEKSRFRTAIPDPMETLIHEALTEGGFAFSDDERANDGLDFVLKDKGLAIEVKQFHSPRIAKQMARCHNVIACQGRAAVEFMAELLRAYDGSHKGGK